MTEGNEKKGHPACRCECCSYWRRHCWRIAANADTKVGRAKKRMDNWKKQADKYRASANRVRGYYHQARSRNWKFVVVQNSSLWTRLWWAIAGYKHT